MISVPTFSAIRSTTTRKPRGCICKTSRWPDGVYCPFCGALDDIKPVGGASMGRRLVLLPGLPGQVHGARRDGLRALAYPAAQVAAGLPLDGVEQEGRISAHQLHRTLGITYKSAWFMAHRIREAMTDTDPAPLGGEGKIIEADETYYGRAGDPKDSDFRERQGLAAQGRRREDDRHDAG